VNRRLALFPLYVLLHLAMAASAWAQMVHYALWDEVEPFWWYELIEIEEWFKRK